MNKDKMTPALGDCIEIFCILPALCSGGSTLGAPEESTGHELRQAEPLAEVLLREGHHAEGKGRSCFSSILQTTYMWLHIYY